MRVNEVSKRMGKTLDRSITAVGKKMKTPAGNRTKVNVDECILERVIFERLRSLASGKICRLR